MHVGICFLSFLFAATLFCQQKPERSVLLSLNERFNESGLQQLGRGLILICKYEKNFFYIFIVGVFF